MAYLFRTVLLSVLVFGCSNHQVQKIDKDDFRSDMTESSKLFFRNVRQTYYDVEEHQPSKSTIFRMSAREKSEEKPVLNVFIRQVVVQDKVFAMVESNTYLADLEEFEIHWKDSKTQQEGIYTLPKIANAPLHYAFATEIYSSIQANHSLNIKTKKGLEPILADETAREAFRKTMVDFYRLVNLL